MAKREQKVLEKKNWSNTFMLIGEAKVNDYTYKLDEKSEKSDWVYNSLNLGVYCGETCGTVYAELMGGYGAERDNVVYVHGKDSEGKDDFDDKFTIDWDDRFDEEVVKTVASYKKTDVDLGEELGGRKEFITLYDAIEYIRENLPKYTGKVTVIGQMVKEFYNGKYYDKFKLQSLYAVPDDRKNRLLITSDIYYNKNCVDKSDYKSDKVIYVDGYIQQYINKDEGTKYIPQRFVFNASKYDPENEKHQKLLNYKLKYIDINDKNMQHMIWEVVMINGAEEVEFDESQLTKAQREQFELGIRTLDDFKPKGAILGGRVNEYRLFDPKLTGDFADGLVDTEMKESEFEEMVYAPAIDEKLDDVVEKAEAKTEESKTEEIEDDDLF